MEHLVVASNFTSETSAQISDDLSYKFIDKNSYVHSHGQRKSIIIATVQKDGDATFGIHRGVIDFPIFRTGSCLAGAIGAMLALTPATFAAQTLPSAFSFGSTSNVSPIYRDRKFEKAKARLDELVKKLAGWKGAGSVSMSKTVYEASEVFLKNYFLIGNMLEPFIGLDGDGDITLFWKDENIVIDLSISEDKTYSYFARTSEGEKYSSDGTPISEAFPMQILNRLSIV